MLFASPRVANPGDYISLLRGLNFTTNIPDLFLGVPTPGAIIHSAKLIPSLSFWPRLPES